MSTAADTEPASRTSSSTPSAPDSNSAAVACARSRWRLVTATRAPACTSACAIARPRPLVPPVTRTRVSLSCAIEAQPSRRVSALGEHEHSCAEVPRLPHCAEQADVSLRSADKPPPRLWLENRPAAVAKSLHTMTSPLRYGLPRGGVRASGSVRFHPPGCARVHAHYEGTRPARGDTPLIMRAREQHGRRPCDARRG